MKSIRYQYSLLGLIACLSVWVSCTKVSTTKRSEIPQVSFDSATERWQGVTKEKYYNILEDTKASAVTVAEGTGYEYSEKTGKYFNVRIPVAEVANDGSIILLWQGRFDGTDRGYDHLLISRSTDWGETWEQQIIFNEDNVDLGDNSLVIDRYSGRLFAIAYSGMTDEKQLIFVSNDNGKNWERVPHNPITNNDGAPLRMRGTTGIQIRRDNTHPLILPAITENGKLAYMKCDKDKQQWEFLVQHSTPSYNEPSIVELMDTGNNYTRILNITRRINAENNNTYKQQSQYIYQSNINEGNWMPDNETGDFSFNTTKCNQHIKRYSGISDGYPSRILYSSTINGIGFSPSRYGGVVALSYDEGKSWISKTIVPKNTHFGYSCQVILPDGSIGLFYETHNDKYKKTRYGAIKFIRYTLGWLTEGQDKYISQLD